MLHPLDNQRAQTLATGVAGGILLLAFAGKFLDFPIGGFASLTAIAELVLAGWPLSGFNRRAAGLVMCFLGIGFLLYNSSRVLIEGFSAECGCLEYFRLTLSMVISLDLVLIAAGVTLAWFGKVAPEGVSFLGTVSTIATLLVLVAMSAMFGLISDHSERAWSQRLFGIRHPQGCYGRCP